MDQGTVTFDEQPFTQQKQRVFYYESSNWFDPNMAGMDYLKLVKQLWQSQVNIAEEIRYWQMTDYIKLPIKKYSLGMKQKLLIAMYIISDASYLFMDEISNGLDDNSRQKLLDRLQTLSVAKCILLTSHYRNEIAPIADQILELKNQTMAVLPA
ncbi:ATP-binding cassette domain-containing protein [Secundilactobacillus similis]|uniref:ATP-binding cassette domain-containing protein n=1 Tax=Secundilactobacillus similis TaxID=414682 RepID=UPI001CDA580D|nr:ATP-binding cassette domain-containing protein [Secundilactobacillus similis]